MKSLVTFFMCLSAFFATAQEQIVQSNLKGMVSHNQSQLASLAEAFSEDQYAWRPAEGVRSIGEAFLHVASVNYYLASRLGFPPPEDINMMTMEQITGKANIIAALNKSFDFILDKIGQIDSVDFEKEADMGFAKMSTLSAMFVILEHSGEHKGQLIAYARSNGITPPWSK